MMALVEQIVMDTKQKRRNPVCVTSVVVAVAVAVLVVAVVVMRDTTHFRKLMAMSTESSM